MDLLKQHFQLIANEIEGMNLEILAQKIERLHTHAKSLLCTNATAAQSSRRLVRFSPTLLDLIATSSIQNQNLLLLENISNTPILCTRALQRGEFNWTKVMRTEYKAIIQFQLRHFRLANLTKFKLSFIAFRIREFCAGTNLNIQTNPKYPLIYIHSLNMKFFINYPKFIEHLDFFDFSILC